MDNYDRIVIFCLLIALVLAVFMAKIERDYNTKQILDKIECTPTPTTSQKETSRNEN